jgi:hypothetical protein
MWYFTKKGGKPVRRLHPPTLVQRGCEHQWKTTTSRPGQGDVVRMRYLTCRRCGLKVKTEERLAVPWDARDFMAVMAQAFPEDTVVDVASLQAQGVLGEGLSQLNAHLVPHGWQMDLVWEQGQVIGVMRRRMSSEALGGTNDALDKRKNRRHGKNDC